MLIELQHTERKAINHVLGHLVLDVLQPVLVERVGKGGASGSGGQVELPLSQERVSSQQAPANMLSKNAPVLVGRVEMLTNPNSKIILSGVSTDPHDTFYVVSHLAFLEEDIDPVLWHRAQIFAPETRQVRKRMMQKMTCITHGRWWSNHCNCLPKLSPSMGIEQCLRCGTRPLRYGRPARSTNSSWSRSQCSRNRARTSFAHSCLSAFDIFFRVFSYGSITVSVLRSPYLAERMKISLGLRVSA